MSDLAAKNNPKILYEYDKLATQIYLLFWQTVVSVQHIFLKIVNFTNKNITNHGIHKYKAEEQQYVQVTANLPCHKFHFPSEHEEDP